MKFVIFHGVRATPQSNWFPWLKMHLEEAGQDVLVPEFPTPVGQSLDAWLGVFDGLRKDLQGEKLCFIAHSLAPLFVLHAVEKYNIELDGAIFVSPFLSKLQNPKFDVLNASFFKEDFDFEKLKKLIPNSSVIYSDSDPAVPPVLSLEFAEKLGSETFEIKNGGHLNAQSGFTTFPLVLELCRKRLEAMVE